MNAVMSFLVAAFWAYCSYDTRLSMPVLSTQAFYFSMFFVGIGFLCGSIESKK